MPVIRIALKVNRYEDLYHTMKIVFLLRLAIAEYTTLSTQTLFHTDGALG